MSPKRSKGICKSPLIPSRAAAKAAALGAVAAFKTVQLSGALSVICVISCRTRVRSVILCIMWHQGHRGCAIVLGGVDIRGPSLYKIHPHGSTDSASYAAMGSGSLNAMAVLEAGEVEVYSHLDCMVNLWSFARCIMNIMRFRNKCRQASPATCSSSRASHVSCTFSSLLLRGASAVQGSRTE